jgi:YegS/Rv2252/BmrU family lipid kinase
MRVGVIINPISGRRAGSHRAVLARRLLDRMHVDAEVLETTARGDAARFARDFVARDFDRIVAWGGDGTINETAGPLAATRAILGVVPSGSGDGLAGSLGLPRTPEQALAAAIERPARAIDLGWLGDRHFLNIGGIGFDAAIAHAFNARSRRGGLGYLTNGLSLACTYGARPYELQIGDEPARKTDVWLMSFANGSQYGNGVIIAADADPSDGWLNAVIVAPGSTLRQFWRARRLLVGRLRPAEGVLRTRLQRATITGTDFHCHVDGETFMASGTITVRVEHGAMKVAC